MKLPKISNGQAQILLGIAGLGVAVAALYYTKKQVKDAAQAINPTNQDNVINKGINSLFGFDNKTQSIGTWIYDKTHSEPTKQVKTARTPEPAKPVYQSSTTPQQAQKMIAPFLAKEGGEFRFYQVKP